jgi:hypothetical protein
MNPDSRSGVIHCAPVPRFRGPVERSVPGLVMGALLLASATFATASPTIMAAPHQTRTRVPDAVIVPLWHTTWWITLAAGKGDAPLTRLEYKARFTDGEDLRPITGAWALSGGEREGLSGRVNVACPSRLDYERPLRVELRVLDAGGGASDWVEINFPVRAGAQEPAIAAMPLSVAPKAGRRNEVIGSVEVEAGDDLSIGEVKDALKRKARDRGGDAAVNFRMASSSGGKTIFAADAVRYADSTRTVTPQPIAPPSDRVLGEITMPTGRR